MCHFIVQGDDMKNNARSTWEIYTLSWSESDASERLKLFEQSLSPDCVYIDPLIQTNGYEQLSGYMIELHKMVPRVQFITTAFSSHHDRSLAQWNMLDANGNVLSQGASYGLYGIDGRLIQMTGFYAIPDAI